MRISTYRFLSLFCSFCLFLFLFVTSSLHAQTTIPFTDVTTSAGISFWHTGIGPADAPMFVGTAAVWLDYDQDGDQDLFLTTRIGKNEFYENQGNGTFIEKAKILGVDSTGDSGGASAADFNNDGWPDLFVTNADDHDFLYKNIGGQYFQEISKSAGFDSTETHRGTSASWGDYDGDGFLDLYTRLLHNYLQEIKYIR